MYKIGIPYNILFCYSFKFKLTTGRSEDNFCAGLKVVFHCFLFRFQHSEENTNFRNNKIFFNFFLIFFCEPVALHVWARVYVLIYPPVSGLFSFGWGGLGPGIGFVSATGLQIRSAPGPRAVTGPGAGFWGPLWGFWAGSGPFSGLFRALYKK